MVTEVTTASPVAVEDDPGHAAATWSRVSAITRRPQQRAGASASTARSSNGTDDAGLLLARLVSPAGDDQRVTRPGQRDRRSDGLPAVGLDDQLGSPGDCAGALLDRRQDLQRVLASAGCRW